MNTPTEQPSATPILDLLEPLPKFDAERTNGRFAFPFLTFVAVIVFTGNLPSLFMPLGFLIINFSTIAIHEIGHLIAGWSAGLRFKGVRIDPFRIRIDSGRWRFRIRPRLFRGFAYMSLYRVRRIRSRLACYVFGGPAASLLLGIAAAVSGEMGLAHHYDSPWPTFLEFFGVWSFFIGCIALISFKSLGFANDGMILRALLFRNAEALPMIASYALSAVKTDTPFSPGYVMRWFRLAARSSPLQSNHYAVNWVNYADAQEEEVAAECLERCLAVSGYMEQDHRDMLIAESAFFTASRRNDPTKAAIWFNRIQSPDRLHVIWRSRARIALLCAQEEFDEAASELNAAVAFIRAQPASAQGQKLESEWIAWREQIEARSRLAVVT
jgi:hypothetical protein